MKLKKENVQQLTLLSVMRAERPKLVSKIQQSIQ